MYHYIADYILSIEHAYESMPVLRSVAIRQGLTGDEHVTG